MPSFLHSNGTFFPPSSIPPTVYSPLTGTSVAIPGGTARVFLTPAGTLAALTLKLPPNPRPGQSVSIISTQTVTALTMQTATAGAVAGSPTALVINTEVLMTWTGTAWIWVK